MKSSWTAEHIEILKRDFPVKTAGSIAKALGRSTGAVFTKAWHLGLEKPDQATNWTRFMINFLKSQHNRLTNKQLADALGLTLTVTRNKLAELGIKRMVLEYWTAEQVEFLKKNYKTIGDVELAKMFQERWRKNKKWSKSHIVKKRGYLGLNRTQDEYEAIRTKNSSSGGSAFTIDKNSSSLNMHPTWVAQRIAWRNPELQQALVDQPQIIDAARQLIKLKRVIKSKTNNHV